MSSRYFSNPICITTIDHKILRVNKSYREIWPDSDLELETAKCYETRPGNRCHTDLCPLTQVLNGKQEVLCEVIKIQEGIERDFIIMSI